MGNLMMNGTMRMLTSGAAKDGAVTTTSTADHLTSTMPPRVLLLPARHTTLHGRVMLRLQATTMMLGPSRHMDKTTTQDGASLTTQLKHATTLTSTTLVKSVPMTTSGLRTATSMPRATTMLMAWPHLLTRQLTALLTSRRLHTAEVPNTGAATSPIGTLGAVTRTSTRRSLMMTPGPSPTLLSPMTNGTTVMPTNGAARLGAATVTSTVPHPTVARPLLTNTTDTLRVSPLARWDGPKEVSTTPPLALDTLETTANPDLTGMHGAVTRTSRSTNPMNRHGLSPMMLSHTTNGTTSTEINGAHRHGARTAIFTVLPLTTVLLPVLTTLTKPTVVSPDTADGARAALSLMAAKLLLTTSRPPRARRPLLVPTMPTHGPSGLTALTTTPGGASPMTSSTPTSTTTSSTPARCALTTTSGPRTGMSTRRRTPMLTVKLHLHTVLNQRSPRLLTHLTSATAVMATVATVATAATDGEHLI